MQLQHKQIASSSFIWACQLQLQILLHGLASDFIVDAVDNDGRGRRPHHPFIVLLYSSVPFLYVKEYKSMACNGSKRKQGRLSVCV